MIVVSFYLLMKKVYEGYSKIEEIDGLVRLFDEWREEKMKKCL